MKTKTTLLIVGIVLAALMATASSVSAAEISTDKPEYEPGENVLISGTGFLSNTVVQITITRPNGQEDSGSITADGDGAFQYTYDLNGIHGVYLVDASDGTNTAQTTFDDTSYAVESYESDCATIKNSFEQGETVYAKAIRNPPGANMKLRFKNPSGAVVYTSPNYGYSPFTSSYTLENDAPTGQWTIEIGRCDYWCSYDWTWYWSYGEDHFTVTTPGENEIPEFSTIALPVASILGLLFFFNYRKRRKE